jgi:hypothetical protein
MVCPINHSHPNEIEYCVFFRRSWPSAAGVSHNLHSLLDEDIRQPRIANTKLLVSALLIIDNTSQTRQPVLVHDDDDDD